MAKRQTTPDDVSGWVGWVYFAGFMLVLVGVLHAIAGLVGLFNSSVYVVAEESLWLLDYTSWGWIHLIFGIILLFAGSAIMSGKMWGRVVGIIISGLALIANFGFVPVYPFWSILMMVVNILVIYALIVHGDEARDTLE